MKKSLIIIACFLPTLLFSQKNASVSFEKWISLKNVFNPIISPDGRTIVYSTNSTDWANNSYDSELWMSRDGGEPIQLTRTTKGNSTSAQFTPDSKFVSFLADRGEKNQIYIIAVNGGEAIQVTKDEDGINSYQWSYDGNRIVYVNRKKKVKKIKPLKNVLVLLV